MEIYYMWLHMQKVPVMQNAEFYRFLSTLCHWRDLIKYIWVNKEYSYRKIIILTKLIDE